MYDALHPAYQPTNNLRYVGMASAAHRRPDDIRRPARSKAERRRIRRMWWLCSSFADIDDLAPRARTAA